MNVEYTWLLRCSKILLRHTRIHPALRCGTDKNCDNGKEDEPPLWSDCLSCDGNGKSRRVKWHDCRRRRKASLSGSMYFPLVAGFIFSAFILFGLDSKLCDASKDPDAAFSYSDTLSVVALDGIVSDPILITSNERGESQQMSWQFRDQDCNFECCTSFRNTLDSFGGSQLRGGVKTRILQATTENDASNPCTTQPPEEEASGMAIPRGLQY
ncbi:hypothetical protein ACHAWX_000269, partial [Stephanocyclus meneghinianus]